MNQFTWGIWLTTGTPYGSAKGSMEERQFRDLLKALLPMMGWDVDRAVDSVKELMVKQLNSVVMDRRKAAEAEQVG